MAPRFILLLITRIYQQVFILHLYNYPPKSFMYNKANTSVFNPTFVSVKLLVASGASLTVTKFRRGRPKDTAVSLLIFSPAVHSVLPKSLAFQVQVALYCLNRDKTNSTKWQIFKFLVWNGAPLNFNMNGKSARALSAELGWMIPDDVSIAG